MKVGDRIIFWHEYEREGVITEVSPSGLYMKLAYQSFGSETEAWFKDGAVRDLLGPAPKRSWWTGKVKS